MIRLMYDPVFKNPCGVLLAICLAFLQTCHASAESQTNQNQSLTQARANAHLVQPLASIWHKRRLEIQDKRYQDAADVYGIAPPVEPEPIPNCVFEGGLCGALNADGSIAVPPQWDFVDDYHEGRARVRLHGLYGFIDTNGRTIIPPRYTSVGHYENAVVGILIRDKIALFDLNGKQVLGPKFRRAFHLGKGLYWVDAEDKPASKPPTFGSSYTSGMQMWGLIDGNEKWVVHPKRRGLELFDKKGSEFTWIKTSKAWGLMKADGTWLWRPQFTYAGPLYRSRAQVKRAGFVGFLGPDGRFAIEAKFDQAGRFFASETTWAMVDGKVALIDRSGAWIVEPIFPADDLRSVSFKLKSRRVTIKKNGKVGIADLEGRIIIPPQFNSGPTICEDGRVFGWISKKRRAFHPDGKPMDLPKGFHSDNVCREPHKVQVDDKYGLVDRNFKTIVPPIYDMIQPFRHGFAVVKKNDKFGFIKEDGTIVVEPKFEWAKDFYSGVAEVQLDGEPGLIDVNGTWVYKPQFTHMPPRNRVALRVISGLVPEQSSDGHWGFIDATGKFVIPPKYQSVSPFNRGIAYVKIDNLSCPIDRRGQHIAQMKCKPLENRTKKDKSKLPIWYR